MDSKNIILGAGVSGLGAAYALLSRGAESIILEKDSSYGGLCNSFEINGFVFDRFVHLSFSGNDVVNNLFLQTGGVIVHKPNPANIYKKLWVKHPAQNNLYPLSEDEKKFIIKDFTRRESLENIIKEREPNYEDWLRCQFGNYFAEHFPMVYTRKYWMKEAHDLRTEWVGARLYQPSIEEVIAGSKKEDERITYYAKEMRYPEKGGYKSFLKPLADVANIRYSTKVVVIDFKTKLVIDSDGNKYHYERLISSLPLPEVVSMLDGVPQSVRDAVAKLECTSGYHISVALRTKNIPPYLWWYIYDEDIMAARVYSPSLKSPDNAPDGCSSLQMEVYRKEGTCTEQQLLDGTVGKLIELGIINKADIIFTHIGFEKYANVIFTEPIYKSRMIVRDYLSSIGIETIGRFGEWDYLWSDQSLLSGLNIKV